MDDQFTLGEVLSPENKATSTSIVEAVMASPVVVFTDKAKQEKFYTDIKAEVDAFVPDVSTAKGRAAIASLAFRVTKCKTGIDAAGKKLNEDARAHINAVDAARRDIRERLDALSEVARQPLTEWELAEENRQKAVQAFFDAVDRMASVYASDTSSRIAEKLAELREMEAEITAVTFADRKGEAHTALSKSVSHMETELARTLKAEADAAELERLRADEVERLAAEQAMIAAEAEKARLECEAAEAEERRQAQAKAEADRIAQAEREASERAAREAQEAAARAQAERDRQHAEALAAEKRRADQAEASRKAEADRIERECLAKERAEAAQKAADEKRASDQKHRSAVMGKAKEALMAHADIDEATAKRVVLAITGGNIPAVSIAF